MKFFLKGRRLIKGGKNTLGTDRRGRPHWRSRNEKALMDKRRFCAADQCSEDATSDCCGRGWCATHQKSHYHPGG